MPYNLQPIHLVLMILAGWINEEQQRAIEHLRAENQVLNEKIGKRRILLTDDLRRLPIPSLVGHCSLGMKRGQPREIRANY